MLEARTIRLTRYADRRSVLEAEPVKIQAKRPLYNVQHNRHEIEVNVSIEDMAAAGAAVCLGILVLQSLADAVALWWVRHLASRQEVPVTLPAKPSRFTEPSLPLTLFNGLTAVSTGHFPVIEASESTGPATVSAVTAPGDSASPLTPPHPIPLPLRPSALGMVILAAYCLISSQQGRPSSGPAPSSSLCKPGPETAAGN